MDIRVFGHARAKALTKPYIATENTKTKLK